VLNVEGNPGSRELSQAAMAALQVRVAFWGFRMRDVEEITIGMRPQLSTLGVVEPCRRVLEVAIQRHA